METLWLIAIVWSVHAVPAFLGSLPFWFFGRHRAQWFKWELSILVVPLSIWLGFTLIDDKGKSLGNLVEAVWLGCAIPLAAIIRVVLGGRVDRRRLAIGLIVLASLAGILLWAFVPMLPE